MSTSFSSSVRLSITPPTSFSGTAPIAFTTTLTLNFCESHAKDITAYNTTCQFFDICAYGYRRAHAWSTPLQARAQECNTAGQRARSHALHNMIMEARKHPHRSPGQALKCVYVSNPQGKDITRGGHAPVFRRLSLCRAGRRALPSGPPTDWQGDLSLACPARQLLAATLRRPSLRSPSCRTQMSGASPSHTLPHAHTQKSPCLVKSGRGRRAARASSDVFLASSPAGHWHRYGRSGGGRWQRS